MQDILKKLKDKRKNKSKWKKNIFQKILIMKMLKT